MRLIVGLGNPGFRYRSTKHNLGFLVIDRFSKANRIKIKEREYDSLTGKGVVAGSGIMLMKPITFMNRSGKAVKAFLSSENLDPSRMIVVYDDVNLELGDMRFRTKGSAGGHNGIESIIENLKTDCFQRLKIGIGGSARPDLTEYVLRPFERKDKKLVNTVIDRAMEALDCWVRFGIEVSMQRFNA